MTTGLRHILGDAPSMVTLRAEIARVARAGSDVLVLGEPGSGKELVAEAIHSESPRCARPFIAADCARFHESLADSELFGSELGGFTGARSRPGFIERATRGTLFLDEIGNLPAYAQQRLLRTLEERTLWRVGGEREITVDVRVVAATNADLDRMVATGAFRNDLLDRLDKVRVRVPPLRERLEDVEILTVHILKDLSAQGKARRVHPPSAQLLARLREHHWPGNVRELQNCLESLAVAADDGPLDPGRLDEIFERSLRRHQRQEVAADDLVEEGRPIERSQAWERDLLSDEQLTRFLIEGRAACELLVRTARVITTGLAPWYADPKNADGPLPTGEALLDLMKNGEAACDAGVSAICDVFGIDARPHTVVFHASPRVRAFELLLLGALVDTALELRGYRISEGSRDADDRRSTRGSVRSRVLFSINSGLTPSQRKKPTTPAHRLLMQVVRGIAGVYPELKDPI